MVNIVSNRIESNRIESNRIESYRGPCIENRIESLHWRIATALLETGLVHYSPMCLADCFNVIMHR